MGQLTPLAELPNEIEHWGDIAWRLEPGNIDFERVGLDVPQMQRLIGFAGLRAAKVHGYQGERSEIQINSMSVTGINLDSSATGAASASVVKAGTQKTTLEDNIDNNGNAFEFRWPIANIGINRPEIGSLVGHDMRKNRNAVREVIWARHVDRALRSGIVDAAMQGLIKDPWGSVPNRANIAFFGAFEGMIIGMWHDYPFAALYAGFRQLQPLLETYVHDKRHPTHEHKRPPIKLSLFPEGFQPDRLAVTALLAKSARLIRPIADRA